jgi:glycerol-1-phosphate dehydrogenase [NAD(P)+]
MHLYIGAHAVQELVEYCREKGYSRFVVVSDDTTREVLGGRVEAALSGQGWDVRAVALSGQVRADESHVFQVLYQARGEERTYVAVGSGTITDITRTASFDSRNRFLSMPTAPSVDAYTSGGAAMTMGGFKLSVPSHPPEAVFADLPTLRQAPRRMIGAGFGDILGKCVAVADWRLGCLLVGERYVEEMAQRQQGAVDRCMSNIAGIAQATELGIRTLMEVLLDSGSCMAEYGTSRPASGSEHMHSHFWEMTDTAQGRPVELHGTRVGLGALLSAGRYETIRSMSQRTARDKISSAHKLDKTVEMHRIRLAYGPLTDRVLDNYTSLLEQLEADWAALQHQVAYSWAQVQAVADTVPPVQQLAQWLEQSGGISDPTASGLTPKDVQQALSSSRYLRGRFTVDTLGQCLGIW